MSRTTLSLPRNLTKMVEAGVEVGVFSSKSGAIQDALETRFENESYRTVAAHALYIEGELDASEAFNLADLDDPELRAVLIDALGLEEEDIEEVEGDILDTLRGQLERTSSHEDK